MHVKINRWLSTVALVLGIVIMAAVVVFGTAAIQEINRIGDTMNDVSTEEPVYTEEPVLDEYIGEFNPDGTPCVGFGCTPEQDEELLNGEAEANN